MYRQGVATNDIDAVIGANVRRAREEQGLSLDDLCDRINTEADLNWVAGTLSRLETGTRRLRVPELAVLCRSLGVSAEDLLTDDEPLTAPWDQFTGRTMASALAGGSRTPLEGWAGDRVAEQRRKRLADDLDQVVLRALGLESADLAELRNVAFLDYGRDLIDERDRRVEFEEDQGRGSPWGPHSPAALAKYRAAATREITSELRESSSWQTIEFEEIP